MIDTLLQAMGAFKGAIFENAIEPVLYWGELMEYADDVFDCLDFALFGALEILIAFVICRPLELWRPVERWNDAKPVRTDLVYTLVNRIGMVPLFVFLTLAPLSFFIDGYLRLEGYLPPTLEQLVPPLLEWPLLTLFLYIVILDLADYWRHRLQHQLGCWWALHSLHHDQRQMTLWTDDRNHVLDDIATAVWRGGIALLIGVPPTEFPLVLIAFRLVESLSHANVRLNFGRFGSLLLVGPHFHRVHHSVEHAAPPFDRTRGCNFAVIFPAWDAIFRTTRRDATYPHTGVADIGDERARAGYLRHQLDGVRRLASAVVEVLRPVRTALRRA